MERLQKYLSNCGVASRRKSEKLIKEGRVKVNGETILELGFKVDINDIVSVDGVDVKKEDKVYYLLYKPEKIISSVKDDKGRKTVIDLIDTKEKIFPIGRLDYDTSGLLLLTNDGNLSNLLTHPSHNINKIYSVKLSGIIKSSEVKELEKGIVIDGVKTKKSIVKIKKIDKKNNKSYVEITITEGRYHQVKNMFAYFGYQVVKLKRTNYAFLDLSNLRIGEYRKLTPKEVKKLYSLK